MGARLCLARGGCPACTHACPLWQHRGTGMFQISQPGTDAPVICFRKAIATLPTSCPPQTVNVPAGPRNPNNLYVATKQEEKKCHLWHECDLSASQQGGQRWPPRRAAVLSAGETVTWTLLWPGRPSPQVSCAAWGGWEERGSRTNSSGNCVAGDMALPAVDHLLPMPGTVSYGSSRYLLSMS